MKEVDHEQWQWLGFAVKLMALIPYYERDLIIIKRVKVYKYTNTREKRQKHRDNKRNYNHTLI